VRDVFIGENFHFGKRRQGDSALFKQIAKSYRISVHAIKPVCVHKKIVSSSALRVLVKEGDLVAARRYLGRDVSVLGCVVHGDARGRRLGIPTANVNPGQEILPPTGVYIVKISLQDQVYGGIANIGHRPSFKRAAKKNVEVFIFDFHKNIYGHDIEIRFIKKIRDEKKFDLQTQFHTQIKRDIARSKNYLSTLKSS
jgi:riboflavin kinase/FMN adenylyltransferase